MFRGFPLFGNGIVWKHRDAVTAGSLGVWLSQPFGTVPAQMARHAMLCKCVSSRPPALQRAGRAANVRCTQGVRKTCTDRMNVRQASRWNVT